MGTRRDDNEPLPSQLLYELEQQFVSQYKSTPGIANSIAIQNARYDYVPVFVVEKLRKLLEVQGNTSAGNWNVNAMEVDDTEYDNEKRFEPTFFINSKAVKRSIKQLLVFATLVKDTPGLGFDDFRLLKLFSTQIKFPPLELVWLMTCSKYKLFALNAYLVSLESIPDQNFLTTQIVCFGYWSAADTDDSKKTRLTKIMSVIVPEIVIASYANPESNDQLIRLKNVADNVVTGIQSRLLSDDPCQRWSQQVLSVYLQDVLLPADLRKKYRVDHMNQILSKTVTLTLQDIQRQQEKFTAQTQSEEQYLGAKEAIFSILRHPGMLDEAFELVEQRVQEGNVNWEMVLVITTVATTTLEQYRSQSTFNVFSFLKQIIHKILSSSIVSRNSEGIVGAFVMARHCCLISPSKFDRYEKWYTGTFGGETTTPARSPEKFTFLACVLSDMLPNDPICFLQVHTIYWPFVPAGMRNVWSDYIGSAKIRIGEEQDAELELAEENLPNPNNPIQLDIDRVIKAFEAVQKVPAAITEMLMFRKRYYFDQFLPALLRKPHGKPASDVRVRLIGALHSSGKIPTALYEAYKSG